MSQLTKQHLRTALKLKHEHEIAEFFGISPSAVSQWPEETPIPELRQLQAITKRPDLFSPPAANASAGG
jgi:transcriptional regulator with XRE-family HTH domain